MRQIVFLISMLLTSSIFAATVPSPTGLWNTFDESGSLLSTVDVQIKAAELYGHIVAVHTGGEENPVCDQCKGELFGKPLIGMQIINGLTLKKSVWQKGSVFDPKTGNSYRAKVWVDDDKLLVRGYVGFLYQTQYWEKATE